eukprot:2847097-Rhodomonas_salina.7
MQRDGRGRKRKRGKTREGRRKRGGGKGQGPARRGGWGCGREHRRERRASCSATTPARAAARVSPRQVPDWRLEAGDGRVEEGDRVSGGAPAPMTTPCALAGANSIAHTSNAPHALPDRMLGACSTLCARFW